jgi:hypothetical protein
MPTVEVRGLKQAAANLRQIGGAASKDLSRKSMLAAGLVIDRAVVAGTYSTFQRKDGAIKAGFGVRVAKDLKGNVLRGYIVQYPTGLAFRPKRSRSAKQTGQQGIAFWWRFLEMGTQGRRTKSTPKFLREGRVARGKRQHGALKRYYAAASLNDLAARPWVRPAFGSAALGAIEEFRKQFTARVEEQVSNLQK